MGFDVTTFISDNIVIILVIIAIAIVIYAYMTYTPQQAVDALAKAAQSPAASNPEQIIPLADIATKAATTSTGKDAVSNLAQTAISKESMTPAIATATAKIATDSM